MRRAGLFPERSFLRPIALAAAAHRGPCLDPDRGGVAPCAFGELAQRREDVERLLPGWISIRHPAVTPFGDARQRALMVAAEPDRHLARGRPRVDPGVVDRVPLALEGDMILRPQHLHDLHLLLGAAAAIVEILVEAGKLHLVPPHSDPEPEPAAA